MLVLVVEPGNVPNTREITNSLQEMQKVVGGMVQVIYPFPNQKIALVCNEEGLLLGLPPNRGLRDEDGALYDIVCGTFFLCGASASGEVFMSLTQEQVEQAEKWFHTPEVFVGMGGHIVCLPME